VGDPHITHADIKNANYDFGWQPLITPEDGIALTVKQYYEFNKKIEKK
jgi:nucleoside-diphosphate-sugar epimerase